AASYPFVAALAALVSDVKSVLGSSTKATYAADWSEYVGHQPSDGSGDVYFNLDPLWSSPDIDAVGIDLYWPLSDWRNGREHLDAMAGASSIYDLDYLKSNIAGGEGYDWYYASPADRALQDRTPIADGYGKPWVFRYKDLASWWSNRHFDRPDGVEAASPTAWIAGSKPVWLLECGCPAVDKGANQPNVFVDPKSAESVLPYFSDGRRDDLIQRRYLQALVEAFDPDHPDHVPGLNPVSTVYGSVMVDPARIYAYAWDARPYPAFPNDIASWGDGGNWRLGHWLNGRVAGAPLADVVGAILDDSGFTAYDTRRLEGVVSGYAIDRIMSAREALQPLELSFFFDAVESEGRIVFRHRGADAPVATVESDTMVEPSRSSFPFTLTRGQESELPSVAKIAFVNAAIDYRQGIAEARRIAAGTGRTAQADLAIALEPEVAEATAQVWLYETWIARERASFSLGPTHLAVEPGDLISIHHGETDRLYRVTAVSERGEREIEALAIDPELYAGVDGAARGSRIASPPTAGQPLADFIDLPLLRGNEPDEAGYVAASQTPWPGAVAFYSAPGVTGYSLAAVAAAPATTGMTLDALPAGRGSRIDNGARFRVKLDRGELASATRLGLLAGDNVAAMRTGDGEWEVIQFETATLQSPGIYELSGLLRGQAGTEGAILVSLAAGARFVLINDALARIDLASAQVGLPLNWRYGPADRDLGDESYAAVTHSFRGVGRRPLSPVHVHGRRADGNLFMHWIRRTRIESDSWDAVAVPLGEDLESYEIDILSAGTVIRTLASATTSATYTASQQTADFGSPQSEMDVRVYQLSAVWGRGTPAQAVL
ncbi:MAG: glycoside hydrolase/phage tail family protein, partial [Hyphomicrobiaceae bacterium]